MIIASILAPLGDAAPHGIPVHAKITGAAIQEVPAMQAYFEDNESGQPIPVWDRVYSDFAPEQ